MRHVRDCKTSYLDAACYPDYFSFLHLVLRLHSKAHLLSTPFELASFLRTLREKLIQHCVPLKTQLARPSARVYFRFCFSHSTFLSTTTLNCIVLTLFCLDKSKKNFELHILIVLNHHAAHHVNFHVPCDRGRSEIEKHPTHCY